MFPKIRVGELLIEPRLPFRPSQSQFGENRFEISARIVPAVHWQAETDAPDSPPARFDGHDLSEVRWIVNFPNQTRSASLRCDYKGISLVARLSLEIGDLAKCETIHGNVIKNDETMIYRRTVRAGNERWLGRRCALRRDFDSQRSSLRYIVHHSLPSAAHLRTSPSTENIRRGSDSKRPPSVYAVTSSGMAS